MFFSRITKLSSLVMVTCAADFPLAHKARKMTDIINSISGLLWGHILVYLLIAAGLFFTLRLGFIQFTQFPHMIKVMFQSRQGSGDGISSFQAFCTSLAARVGTGNMAGVAVALYLGGAGAIFWMWLIALIGMATSFAFLGIARM